MIGGFGESRSRRPIGSAGRRGSAGPAPSPWLPPAEPAAQRTLRSPAPQVQRRAV
jgi:hypothetical protein